MPLLKRIGMCFFILIGHLSIATCEATGWSYLFALSPHGDENRSFAFAVFTFSIPEGMRVQAVNTATGNQYDGFTITNAQDSMTGENIINLQYTGVPVPVSIMFRRYSILPPDSPYHLIEPQLRQIQARATDLNLDPEIPSPGSALKLFRFRNVNKEVTLFVTSYWRNYTGVGSLHSQRGRVLGLSDIEDIKSLPGLGGLKLAQLALLIDLTARYIRRREGFTPYFFDNLMYGNNEYAYSNLLLLVSYFRGSLHYLNSFLGEETVNINIFDNEQKDYINRRLVIYGELDDGSDFTEKSWLSENLSGNVFFGPGNESQYWQVGKDSFAKGGDGVLYLVLRKKRRVKSELQVLKQTRYDNPLVARFNLDILHPDYHPT